MVTYWISPSGPSSLGKLRVLNAWMPALWSPSNCVTFPEQPASLASFGSPNHNPRWSVCTGSKAGFFSASWLSTCGAFTLPGANTNNSSLKMPLARTSPWPWLLVVKSAWYQEMPKGLLGCWVTNSSNSVFLGAWLTLTSMICWSVGVVRTSTWALAPLRQLSSTAAFERTILKEVVSSPAKAAAANKAAISSAAPTASTTRLVVMFLLTFLFLSWLTFFRHYASSVDRRSWGDRWRKLSVALPVHPLPRFGLAYSNGRAIYRMSEGDVCVPGH